MGGIGRIDRKKGVLLGFWGWTFGDRWHVGCGAIGVLARHRRFAHNEAQRNAPKNLVGTWGRAVRTSGGRVRRRPSPGGWRAGVRPAACPERQRSGGGLWAWSGNNPEINSARFGVFVGQPPEAPNTFRNFLVHHGNKRSTAGIVAIRPTCGAGLCTLPLPKSGLFRWHESWAGAGRPLFIN